MRAASGRDHSQSRPAREEARRPPQRWILRALRRAQQRAAKRASRVSVKPGRRDPSPILQSGLGFPISPADDAPTSTRTRTAAAGMNEAAAQPSDLVGSHETRIQATAGRRHVIVGGILLLGFTLNFGAY